MAHKYNKEHVRGIILDLDGTLIEYEFDYVINEMYRVGKIIGIPMPPYEELRHLLSSNSIHLIETHSKQKFDDIFWQHFDEDEHPPFKLIAGIKEFLQKLTERQILLGIVTARSIFNPCIWSQLKEFEIDSYFTTIVTKNSNLHWKGKEAYFEDAVKQMKLNFEQCWSVGDRPSDIKSSKKMGFAKSVAVLSGGIYTELLAKENPDYILEHVCELEKIVEMEIK
jgi:phosphoglycolate phosphatase-like HAD superfamily hydrolase